MAIDVQRLKAWPFEEVRHRYTERDSMLYALCLGYGADPLDERALQYVLGPAPATVPTMAAVLAFPGLWMRHPDSGIDYTKVVHGAQRIELHRPLPAAATVVGHTRVKSVVDKGAGKGALVLMSREVCLADMGERLATVEQLNFCRGDGGFSAHGAPGDAAPPPPPPMPEHAPDQICDLPTRPEAALLYRLCGDMNPLHADPEAARAAGFQRPILHGLATYGMAGHAVLKALCGYDAARLRALEARFSAPVFPGEILRIELWQRDGHAVFRVKVLERGAVVLDHGRAELC